MGRQWLGKRNKVPVWCSDHSLFVTEYITEFVLHGGWRRILKEEKTIPFQCLVCVFKDSWEVNAVQDSCFLHLTKAQDKQKHFLLSLRKGTEPPCCLSSGEDLETAQQASSYPNFTASSASVPCFCISIPEDLMTEWSKKMLNPKQPLSYQLNAWGNKD